MSSPSEIGIVDRGIAGLSLLGQVAFEGDHRRLSDSQTMGRVWDDRGVAGRRFLGARAMMCRRCGTPMREEKRSYHKKRKWVCPACGAVRMQQAKAKK